MYTHPQQRHLQKERPVCISIEGHGDHYEKEKAKEISRVSISDMQELQCAIRHQLHSSSRYQFQSWLTVGSAIVYRCLLGMADKKLQRRHLTTQHTTRPVATPRPPSTTPPRLHIIVQQLMLPELLHRSPEALFFPELNYQRFEYYTDAPKYCTTKAPEYYTTTYHGSSEVFFFPKLYYLHHATSFLKNNVNTFLLYEGLQVLRHEGFRDLTCYTIEVLKYCTTPYVAPAYTTQAAEYYTTQAAEYYTTQAAEYYTTQAAEYYTTQAAEYYTTQAAEYYTTQAAEYYTPKAAANSYYTTKATEYYTTSYAATTYYTEASKDYSVLSYHTIKQTLPQLTTWRFLNARSEISI
ncbi:hypothetical protein DAPPUDRAFT_268735 [Daphnia pulex]|uniref:Uncharacterized protein n=1 Tax=Daphnia pulex TaxID=6669 RepID=E9HYA9_DAPPU|nr:hypothetical protein DAPPUDRAFT_268735 [Daphnia pulex]|eukprot:EFX63273.1 hypothetical protein DAPPUDRAFT_268735 [Daphnia pulex]